MLKKMIKTIFLILVVHSFCNLCYATDIKTKIDKSQMNENEIVHLNLSVGSIKDRPDLKPLEKDFLIVGTAKNFQVTVINGVSQETREWTITLKPLRTGDITIPSLQIGTAKTSELKIQVLKTTEAQNTAEQKPTAFLEVSVDKPTVYTQQQVNYTVRLYYTKKFTSGDLSDPQAKNALIIRIAGSKELQLKKDDKLYQVLEYQYAIFPQESGEITITAPEFNGVMSDTANSADSFDLVLLDHAKPIKLVGQNKVINAKPATAGLPVQNLKLTESWSLSPELLAKPLPLGQPITRTITMEAEGLTAMHLPEIKMDQFNGLNIYVDKPKNETGLQGNTLMAKRTVNIVYIPTEPNKKISLPEITIPWWNTNSQKGEIARLPGQIFITKDEAVAQFSTSATNPPANNTNEITTKSALASVSANKVSGANILQRGIAFILPWSLASLFFLAWIFTLVLFFRYKRRYTVTQGMRMRRGELPPLYPQ